MGARLAEGAAAAPLARPHLVGRADRKDGRGHEDPGRHQRLDHAHQGADRHAFHRRAHPRGDQDLRGRFEKDRGRGRGA